MEANSTGGQGSRRAVGPSDDDDDGDGDYFYENETPKLSEFAARLQDPQALQSSDTMWRIIIILVRLVHFAGITLCVTSKRLFIVLRVIF